MYECYTINSILSITTYINTSIIPLPTILLSLVSSTLFRTFQSLCIMVSTCAHLLLTRLAGITLVSDIACLAISFPAALIISAKNIFGFCPSFNLKPCERQQSNKIWPYMGPIIICLFVYNPIYSPSNAFCSKGHLNIHVIMYGSFRPSSLLMITISSSHCLKSVYEAWSCLGARTKSLPFNTQWITSMNVVFGKSGRLLSASLLVHSPKSDTGWFLPSLYFFLPSQILLVHFFKHISTHHWRIHSVLSILSNCSQFSDVAKKSATTIFLCRGPSRTSFNVFGPWIMDWCFFSKNPASLTSFYLLNTL